MGCARYVLPDTAITFTRLEGPYLHSAVANGGGTIEHVTVIILRAVADRNANWVQSPCQTRGFGQEFTNICSLKAADQAMLSSCLDGQERSHPLSQSF